jgi:hypothetical protein
MYVLKYLLAWGLNLEFQAKRQHEYITEYHIIQK